MKAHRPKRSRHAAVLLLCALAAPLARGPAQAGMVSGWWGGNWNCTIDGRPARMSWSAVDDTRTQCSGGACTSTSGARWMGKFSDNGSRWVALTDARAGNLGGLHFRHADGNPWFLAAPDSGRTKGWTTWNGKRYPLSCQR